MPKHFIAQRQKQTACQGNPCQNQNTRQDLIHKFTTQLVKDNALIVVGDVRTTNLTVKRQTSQIGLRCRLV